MPLARSRKWILTLPPMALGAALRLWFIHRFASVDGDPLIYGDVAKNWLLHGIYGLSSSDGIHPTLIRLPGYPLFLAACFRIFGVEHYHAVMYLQTAIDLGTCLLIGAFARRVFGGRAATVALWLAALCPFTANYTAYPLTETLSIFCVALALYSLVRLLDEPGMNWVLLLAFAFGFAAMLRPDGALLAVALCPAVAWYGGRTPAVGWRRALRLAMMCGVLSILPFVPWTVRNWRTFHLFEPLAPRYAVDPGESPTPGFNRWMRTWCVDYASTYEIYWNANSDKLDVNALPTRAFDSASQRAETAQLFDDYNEETTVTPAFDARFEALAEARIHGHRLRYYVGLPVMRTADMWLRPRVENLNIELQWWNYDFVPTEAEFAGSYALLNLAYLVAALVGLCRWPRLAGAMLAFVVLRSILLGTLEAPETRYTLECFPVVIALAGVAFGGKWRIAESSTAPAATATP